jgi:fructan beta-fructosidase
MMIRLALSLMLFCVTTPARADEPDLVVADFEGKDYGAWKATGEAFGPGPARGTLPKQMEVTGFEGNGLVNSYSKGDGSTGTLTSPPFAIQRKYLNFLIGGGMHPGRTCINLLVNGKIVRTATGPNDRPGGSERLDWHSWDVAELLGKKAVIQIVDQETGGWGHINIDQIVQSNRKRGSIPASRELVVERRYLCLPVKSGGHKCVMRLEVGGQPVREFEIELAEAQPDLWVSADVGPWKGHTLKIEVDRLPFGSAGLKSVVQADELPDAQSAYREAYRPQFHFSPRRGWTNDPNGLVYYDGEYHLFFQHNPYGVQWGNMTWGHAVSRDLVHWTELGDAIHPDRLGTIFSGSAVVDANNSAGLQTGENKVLVCIYTAAGGTSAASSGQPFTQSIAFSNDRGRTWSKYAKNPVLGHVAGSNRDPKVVWHEPTGRWIMALFLDGEQYALFASQNLTHWSRLCDIPIFGASECPDFFELPVDGNARNTRWVFWGANGNYLVGRFDGRSFTKESGPHQARFGANDYAAQTYSGIPASDGRRIQIAWMAGGKYPGMPFNQQMTVPRVLTLRTTPEGIRMFIEPVREIEKLRGKGHAWKDLVLKPSENPLRGLAGELFDIQAEIAPGEARQVGLDIRGQKIEYSPRDKRLTALGASAPLAPMDGRIRLRILVDRTSVEVFANDGRVSMASCFLPAAENKRLGVFATAPGAIFPSLRIWELKSIWASCGTPRTK